MATDDLPSLHALRCFEAAARQLSMSQAARELHLTHGAISRHVRALERELEVALFVRGHRRLALTRDGERLAAAVARGLLQVREGLMELRRARGGPIVLSCEPSLALAWLVPRLTRLEQPQVQLTQASGAIDLERAQVDAALRRRDFDLSGYHVTPVMDEWLGPVCAPASEARLRGRGAAVPRLHTRTRTGAWSWWSEASGHTLPSARQHTFDHFSTSIQAAIAGLGAAIGPYPMVKDALDDGRLVAPFGFVRGELGYVLLTQRPPAEEPRVARLLAWLRREATRTHRGLPRA
jgi:LysR family glycine cleavage system transcriptional activator